MGGVISVLIAIFAIVAFMASGNVVMSVFAFLTAFAVIASGLHMRHFSRILARQRLYVEALQRGELKDGCPEAERYWKEMPITVTTRDIQDVPNWIATVNMISTLVALILAIWGGISWLA